MRIDANRLLVLDAVASTGSVAAAAKRLNLVASGVSQHLAALERETGLNLVDRSRRGAQRTLTLTEAGRALAGHAARIREDLADAEAHIATLTDAVEGQLTIAAFPTSLRHLVLPACADLTRAHSAVSVRILELDEATVEQAIHSGRVDVALVERDTGRRPAQPGLSSVHLLDDRYRVVVPAGWAFPTTLTDLGNEPWIEGPPGSVAAAVLHRHRRATGLPFSGAHSCLEYPAVLDLVDAGLGAALMPDLALDNHPPRHARVVELPGLGGRAIHAVHQRQRTERRAVSTFLDALRLVARRL